MIFTEYHCDLIRRGLKTETRRTLFTSSSHPRREYLIGHTYAVQPGRAKSAVASIVITDTWRQRLGDMTPADRLAEGYLSTFEYRAALDSVNGRAIPDGEELKVYQFRLVEEG